MQNFLHKFQSHNGAIAACLEMLFVEALAGFNPTMVRLLLDLWDLLSQYEPEFQSHNGAIAARSGCGFTPTMSWFQSHNGAIAATMNASSPKMSLTVSIPQWCDCCMVVLPSSCCRTYRFNPTMVRLLLVQVTENLLGLTVSIPQWCDCCALRVKMSVSLVRGFQSHNGAIAAKVGRKQCIPPVGCFNPTMVRLLHAQRHKRRRKKQVSIPQWCDCCPVRIRLARHRFVFQSHNGAIAACSRSMKFS